MEHPKAIGDRTTLAAMQALQAIGYAVSVPFGENLRYDLVIDDGERLQRVQCKTGRLRGGAIRFATCSSYGHHLHGAESRRNYLGQVDCFAVHCPDTDGLYLIPIEDVPTKTSAAIRVEPTRNGQKKGIRAAASYEIGRVSVSATRALRASSDARGSSA